MKKNVFRVLMLIISLIIITGIAQTQRVSAVTNFNSLTQKNGVYIVPYGEEIKIDGAKLTSETPEVATIINDDTIRVGGVGNFTVKKNQNETLKFFSWNIYLKKGKFYTYNDESKGKKADVLYSKVYLGVSKTGNNSSVKIEDYLFDGGKYKGSELKGKYFSNHKETGKYNGYFDYSFTKNFQEILPTKIEIEPTTIKLKLGESSELKVTKIEPENAENKTITYKAEDESKIYVEENTGKIEGIGEGTTKVIASTVNGVTAECTVEVYKEPGQVIEVEEITVEPSQLEMFIGKEEQLKATLKPKYADDKSVKWESDNTGVATVTETGLVKAVGKGTANIIATSGNGKSAKCVVIVNDEKWEIHYINSGSRVDAIYMKVGNRSIYIDGGFPRDAKSEIEYLDTLGVKKIDYYIASHSHSNHVGAGPAIINKYGIMDIIVGRETSGDTEASWKAINQHAKKQKIDISGRTKIVMKVGDIITVGSLKITCIGPYKVSNGCGVGSSYQNRNSLMLRFDFGNVSMLACGDNTKTDNHEQANADFPGLMNVDILKNSHHNQNNSKLYQLCQPKYTVFPMGDKKSLKSKTVNTLTNMGSEIFQIKKSKDNHVKFVTDGTTIEATRNYVPTYDPSYGIIGNEEPTPSPTPMPTSVPTSTPTAVPTSVPTGSPTPTPVSTSKPIYNYSKSGTVQKSYSDNSINVSIETIDKYYVSKIWVKDSSNQVKKVSSGSKLRTVNNMLNEIPNAIVGSNASGFSMSSKIVSGNLIITNGIITRQKENQTANHMLGINENGKLFYYEKDDYQAVINDGITNTFQFGPIMIKDGDACNQQFGTVSGKPTQNCHRCAIGQMDENNYVIISTKSKVKQKDVQAFGLTLNLNFLYNLDGGGSTTLWFRNTTSGKGTQIKKTDRAVPDALYFVTAK